MWKQWLSKFPGKISKSDSESDPASSTSGPDDNAGAFPSGIVSGIEPPNQKKTELFFNKLNLCSVVFDFGDSSSNLVQKDAKRQSLVEMVENISAANSKFTDPEIDAMCKMFAANLFRPFPPNCRSKSSTGENSDDDPVFDPCWPHLQIVYELLLKFVTSPCFDAKAAKKYIDHAFILKLLHLFDSEDPRERDCLKSILHRIYGKFMVHRSFIRKSVSNIFYTFVIETEQGHNGISELLEVFGSVIIGFALPLKEEHKFFLWRVLIPLHKPKSVGAYFQQLTFCVMQFIEKEPNLVSSTVIPGLLRYWPVTNSQKEVMFLSELEEILEATDMVEFQKIMIPMFRRIACCINSSHFQVAERALLLWNNVTIISLMTPHRDVILPIIFPAIEKNAQNHWNQAVLNVTLNVRKMFCEMDSELVSSCQKKFDEEEKQRAAMEEKRRKTWAELESMNYQPLVRMN